MSTDPSRTRLTLPESDLTRDEIIKITFARGGARALNPFANIGLTLPSFEGVPKDHIAVYTGDLGGQDNMETLPDELMTSVRRYAHHSRSKATRKKLASVWPTIISLCARYGIDPLPMLPLGAAAICTKYADAEYSLSTILGVRFVISTAHLSAKLSDPTKHEDFRVVFRGIQRAHPDLHANYKIALVRDEVRAMVSSLPRVKSLRSQQEATLLVVGFGGAPRRMEAVLSQVEHYERARGGYYMSIPTSKTDQRSIGQTIFIASHADEKLDPVRALDSWIAQLGATHGPLFRHITDGDSISPYGISDRTFARIVQRAGERICIDSADIGAHSLRSGWATQALLDGVPEAQVAAHLRHKTLTQLLTYYKPRAMRPQLMRALMP
jgi:hypothetical protein